MQLIVALGSSIIRPGATVIVFEGISSGDHICTLHSVTIRALPGAHVVIDGSLTINGSDTIWEGVEVMYSGWATRRTEQIGSAPTDIPLTKTLTVNGLRTTMRRCIFHDLVGPGWWTQAGDGLLEECISYNNGWDAPDRGHGHGLYFQNLIGTKVVKRCVFGGGYSDFNFHAYSEGGSLQGFDIVECASIGRRNLFGGFVPVDRLSVTRCMIWGGSLQTGYQASEHNLSAALTNNILANGAQRVTAGNWANLAETGTDTTTGNRIIVTGNLVIVFNQSQIASVPAPISGRYCNCQNPIETMVLSAGDPLPMTTWTVAAPIAGAGPLATWDSRFGVFIVEA